MTGRSRRQRGITLIEALVALAVMAFGLLGVVGMQATLRSNSDVSKQRAQAVRLGQAQVESWRAFEQLTTDMTKVDYTDIDNVPPAPVPTPNANTTYTLAVNVAPAPPLPASAPKLKTVRVDVGWKDRAGQDNAVRLVSAIAGIAPELSGALSLPADRAPAQRPHQRNVAIPAIAVDNGNGTSNFSPPGTSGITWVFDNVTGVITSICNPTCVDGSHFLLTGVVRFATSGAPTPAAGESPTDPALPVGVQVAVTLPATSTETCFTQLAPTSVAYWCAVPTTTTPPQRWSGQSLLTGLPLSATLGDATASNYKVCRYTPQATDTPSGGNTSHPLVYTDVTGALTAQNFLVISAGDGTTAYGCPGDGPLTYLNSNTYPHQPSS